MVQHKMEKKAVSNNCMKRLYIQQPRSNCMKLDYIDSNLAASWTDHANFNFSADGHDLEGLRRLEVQWICLNYYRLQYMLYYFSRP